MAHKQAKRRRQQKTRRAHLPSIPMARVTAILAAAAVVLLSYQVSTHLLDKPIHSITIEGPFQRVSALQIEESIADELSSGFLSANLAVIQQQIVALHWIDQANVVRRWPNELLISVTEQIPAACWGERGLLNTRGELFVTDARHIPAELPRLSGPEAQAAEVAGRYLGIREQLIPLGMDVRRLHVDPRGAWDMTLQNGIDVRLGRSEVERRTQLFLDVAANVVASREAQIDYIDMRYNNGFTIAWKDGFGSPISDPQSVGAEMVAERSD